MAEPPRKKVRRSNTMASTAAEGATFLELQGHAAESKGGLQTRSAVNVAKAKELLVAEVGDKAGGCRLKQSELETYRKQLDMVFRVFDTSRTGKLTRTELEGALNDFAKDAASVGKACDDVLKQAGDPSGTFVTKPRFISFMVKRRCMAPELTGGADKVKEDVLKHKKPTKEVTPKEGAAPKKKVTPAKKATPAKKKVPAKKKAPAKEESPALESDAPAKEDAQKPALTKGLSISDFFTEFAGLHEEIATEEVDQFGNPLTREYDLGLESAFGAFSVIMYSFHKAHDVWAEPIKALQDKGFRVYVAPTEEEFIAELPKFDQAWFAAHNESAPDRDPRPFVEALKRFHENSGSIAVFAENRPFFLQANEVLSELIGVTLTDNTPGKKTLNVTSVNPPTPGTFSKHLITTGLVKLYEGHTVCRPKSVTSDMQVIGMSSDGYPCFFTVDYRHNRGRVFVDCGFTKFLPEYCEQTAGTARFIRNVAVWLCGLDHRSKIHAPMTGSLCLPELE
eukprot:TRINITY_DN4637_c0_g1_i1.p1 TRINITY_DN4637_c0_g1~~TRINITY_DN4637_c0_g1_i1.p1  ORF type:complete len:508 (+),score=115.85 TRINITY_DN4637_c0_g1_i1:37-1560(+)